MKTIQIIRETGCFKYLNSEKNMTDYFFINNMVMEYLTDSQLQALKTRLEKETVYPICLYKHIETDNLYLTCINTKFKDTYTTAFTFTFDKNGMERALHYGFYEKYIAPDTSYHLLHDFIDNY